MAGLDAQTPLPTEIKLHQKSRVLEIAFANGRSVRLPYEFLRVYSSSAEVRGHGSGQETLQTGKRDVTISTVEPVGHYAVPTFSDGHESGIYSWATCTTSARATMICGSVIWTGWRPLEQAARG